MKHPFRIGERNPALDLVSYGRRGVGRPKCFTRDQIAQIARTVRRAPEVMVKVSGGANTTKGVAAHFSYIGRRGQLEIETDDGERVMGREVARQLVEDWDLHIVVALDRWIEAPLRNGTAHRSSSPACTLLLAPTAEKTGA